MFLRYFLFFIFINPLSAIADVETIQVYRWTDNSGITHLSQFLPRSESESESESENNNITVEKIQMSISASTPPKEEKHNAPMEGIKKYIEERKIARELQIKTVNTAKISKQNCEIARERLALYQSGRRIRTRINDDSEIQVVTEQERIKHIKRLEKNIQSFCNGSNISD